MKLVRSVRAALAVACCICVPSALAGEIVLFDGPGFQGYSVVYNGNVDNLGDAGFNDRASSITVRQGTWELCVDAWYEGGCLQLGPGTYPQLGPPFYRSISSLREVGSADYAVPVPAAPYIELFDREYFQGSVMVFQDTVDNLAGTGFNDQTASISVRSGTWEVCYDAYFQGGCMRLPPGDYPRLDPPFVRSISSLRPVADAGYAGGVYGSAPAVTEVTTSVVAPGASIGFTVASYPDLVPVPGYPVYYAPGLNANYFFYDGLFWIYQRDSWYSSVWYNGPWSVVPPAAVPLFVLRIPVGYYRRPPPYFYGWRADAPPRWGDHWGPGWAQTRYGWDRWDRRAVPPPAPLPTYQRPYAGDRYPRPQQQQSLFSQNYHYRPQDPNVRPQFQAYGQRPGQVPAGQPGGPSAQPPRPGQTPPGPPGGQSAQPQRPTQPPSGQGGQSAQPPRPTQPPPGEQGGQSAQPPRPSQPQPGPGGQSMPPSRPGQAPSLQPGGVPAQPPQPTTGGGRQPRPSSPQPSAQPFAPSGGVPQSGGQPPQGQRPAPPQSQGQGGGRQPSAPDAPNSPPPSGGGHDGGGGQAPRGGDRGR